MQLHDYLLNKSTKYVLRVLIEYVISRVLLLLLLIVLNCARRSNSWISSPLLASSVATRCVLTVSMCCLRLATLILLLLQAMHVMHQGQPSVAEHVQSASQSLARVGFASYRHIPSSGIVRIINQHFGLFFFDQDPVVVLRLSASRQHGVDEPSKQPIPLLARKHLGKQVRKPVCRAKAELDDNVGQKLLLRELPLQGQAHV